MVDSTMCTGEDCPLRKTCYRFRANPDVQWQSYFMATPYDPETKECEAEWALSIPDIKHYRKQNRIRHIMKCEGVL